MNETELQEYLDAIDYLQYGAPSADPFDVILAEQLWSEEHAVQGCYRVLPASVDY